MERNFDNMAIDQQHFGASLGENLLNSMKGSTTTGTTPDMSAAAGLGSAGSSLSNISTMLMLQKILKG